MKKRRVSKGKRYGKIIKAHHAKDEKGIERRFEYHATKGWKSYKAKP